ncbi:MAG: ABC transporter ATP-binding protein [Alphaproteobacteria bacterium]|nr:MAG: ABC transporter ATP-binding protein [Alphaproteobacteria bacterium]
MLEFNDLSYRIGGRPLFDGASAFIADGWKVGLIGRNGTGKSTLLRLIREEAGKGDGSISLRRKLRRPMSRCWRWCLLQTKNATR